MRLVGKGLLVSTFSTTLALLTSTKSLFHPRAVLSMSFTSDAAQTGTSWLSNPSKEFLFGPHTCKVTQAFYETPLSICFVNIKPIVPGHVLVIPKRVCARFSDMTPEEVTDLWLTVYHISPILERHFECEALNLAIQDGRASGQSVPHVHVHVLPRKTGDFRRNDDIYGELNAQRLDKEYNANPHGSAPTSTTTAAGVRPPSPPRGQFDPDKVRGPRTQAEMAAEATELRLLFPRSSL